MKLLITLASALLLCTICFAQTQDQLRSKSDFSNETIYRLNLLYPSFEIEKDVSENISILGNAGFGVVYYNQSGFFGDAEGLILPLQFELSGRYYTNFNRRLDKGKTIANNSGNYIALSFVNVLEAENDEVIVESTSALMAAYGIQRTYWKHFNLNFQTGLGYDFQQSEAAGQLILKLGYTF
ncbi:hypothetical protein [Nonlabens antarcticus]|uniref:hypothetical protein n=1 Tax=Nonlabens antarcticus TaxID=392714 RepID=UPI0018916F32|nr:hypothetical protein [Nonlabens antarcticus]